MAVRGSAETVDLSDLLSLIHGSGHAGTLTLQSGDRVSTLHVHGGQVYLPPGRSRGSHKIGALLVRAKKLSGADLIEALRLQASQRHPERLGDLLVRQGWVQRQDLDEVIRSQFEEEICDLLFEKDSFFEFVRDALPEGLVDRRGKPRALGFDIRSILMEASRRQDEWSKIHMLLPSTRSFYRAAEGGTGEWRVDATGRLRAEAQREAVADVRAEILGRWRGVDALFEECPFDGTRSVDEVVASSGVPQFVAMGVVAQLVEDGLIRELSASEVESLVQAHLKAGRRHLAYKLYGWANESERLRETAERLDQVLLRGEHVEGLTFGMQTSSVRALQLMSRLLRRGAAFRFTAREGDSAVDVFFTPRMLRLHLLGPRRTHSTIRYLRRRRALSEEQLTAARETSERTRRKLERVLVEDGFVDRDTWIRAVKDKIISGLFSMFGWSRPYVELTGGLVEPPDPRSVADGMVCEIPLTQPLRESIRRDMLRWKLLLRAVPSPDAVFVSVGARSRRQRRAHELHDGRRCVGDLIQSARVAPLELVRFTHECLDGKKIRPLSDSEHDQGLKRAESQGRLDQALVYCKSALAFGYAPKLYAEKLQSLRRQLQEAAPRGETRQTLEGELRDVSLAEVLQLLRQGQRTGTLKTYDKEHEQVLYLDRGDLYVLDLGDEEEDEEVWDLLMGPETRLNLDLGALGGGGQLDEDALNEEQLQSIKEDIFDIFFWDQARFEFLHNVLPSEMHQARPGVTKLALNTDKLLFEAMGRLGEWDAMKTRLQGPRARFAFCSQEAKAQAVTGDMPQVSLLFDGQHTLEEIVRLSGEPRFAVYRHAHALVESGSLALASVASTERLPRRPQVVSGRYSRAGVLGLSEEGLMNSDAVDLQLGDSVRLNMHEGG